MAFATSHPESINRKQIGGAFHWDLHVGTHSVEWGRTSRPNNIGIPAVELYYTQLQCSRQTISKPLDCMLPSHQHDLHLNNLIEQKSNRGSTWLWKCNPYERMSRPWVVDAEWANKQTGFSTMLDYKFGHDISINYRSGPEIGPRICRYQPFNVQLHHAQNTWAKNVKNKWNN